MSAQTRIIQTTQDLGTLRDLAELIKDPKAIIAAHELARKEQALTTEEAFKAAEARDFIAKYGEMLKDIKAKQDALEEKKTSHEKEISDANAVLANESKKLDERAKLSDAKEEAFLSEQSLLAKAKSEHDERIKTFENVCIARIRELDSRAASTESDRQYNETEGRRLALLKQTLENKLAKIREASEA